MKIGLIHTTLNSVAPSNAAFHKLDTDIETVNYLNEGIMPELRSTGANSRIIYPRRNTLGKKMAASIFF